MAKTYVDGFVLALPKKKLTAYKKIAQRACKIWLEHGALEYRECVGEDLKTQWGISFPKLTKAKPGETIVFAWIVYKSRAHRDSVNKKVMADPCRLMEVANMPFDRKCISYGGFEVLAS